ncbi:MAG: hypothetical protein IJS96_09895 [Schwartzia sp.]|nr:hypothetical protein [Schwartzia sp. (in: firmicutes)]
MKKTILMAMMATAMMGTTALAATPEQGFCRDADSRYETRYAHCGDGYYGRGHGRRDGYGCGGYGPDDRGYCYGRDYNEG